MARHRELVGGLGTLALLGFLDDFFFGGGHWRARSGPPASGLPGQAKA
jgi:hypothetical protein